MNTPRTIRPCHGALHWCQYHLVHPQWCNPLLNWAMEWVPYLPHQDRSTGRICCVASSGCILSAQACHAWPLLSAYDTVDESLTASLGLSRLALQFYKKCMPLNWVVQQCELGCVSPSGGRCNVHVDMPHFEVRTVVRFPVSAHFCSRFCTWDGVMLRICAISVLLMWPSWKACSTASLCQVTRSLFDSVFEQAVAMTLLVMLDSPEVWGQQTESDDMSPSTVDICKFVWSQLSRSWQI